jgi:hypothetical protein
MTNTEDNDTGKGGIFNGRAGAMLSRLALGAKQGYAVRRKEGAA